MAANGAVVGCARATREAGRERSVSRSPWLIHTASSSPRGEAARDADAFVDLDLGRPVFALVCSSRPCRRAVGHELLAVADAEHRHAELEQARIAARRFGIVDALRATAQDDRGGIELFQRVERQRARVDLAVDVALAHAPRDELRVLRAVVENENDLTLGHLASRELSRRPQGANQCLPAGGRLTFAAY